VYGVPQFGVAQYPQPAGAVRPPYRGMAIASFVVALVGLVFVLIPFLCLAMAVLGVVFGHIAQSHMRFDRRPGSGRGFALAGLIIGYVGIAAGIIAWVGFAVAYANR
jgi:hypothetical protein